MHNNTDAKHYYKGIGLKTNILNYSNSLDAALTGWEFNQLTKPDYKGGPTWDYTSTYHQAYEIYEDAYADCLIANHGAEFPSAEEICNSNLLVQILKPDENSSYQSIFARDDNNIAFNENNKFNILSRIIPVRTEPLGQWQSSDMHARLSEINSDIQLLGLTNSNQDHSAPFHGYYSEISTVPGFRIRQRASFWNQVLSTSIGLNPSQLSGLYNGIENE